MPWNPGIPGWMNELQLAEIETIAAAVPPGGKIVEVGCLYGRSVYCWAASCHHSVTVYAVDPWELLAMPVNPRMPGYTNELADRSKRHFDRYMAGLANVVPVKMFTPGDPDFWRSVDPDVVFIDSFPHAHGHHTDHVEWWAALMRPGTLLCGESHVDKIPGWMDASVSGCGIWRHTIRPLSSAEERPAYIGSVGGSIPSAGTTP